MLSTKTEKTSFSQVETSSFDVVDACFLVSKLTENPASTPSISSGLQPAQKKNLKNSSLSRQEIFFVFLDCAESRKAFYRVRQEKVKLA